MPAVMAEHGYFKQLVKCTHNVTLIIL